MKRFIFFVLVSCSGIGAMQKNESDSLEVSSFLNTISKLEIDSDFQACIECLFKVREKLFCILIAKKAAAIIQVNQKDTELINELTREYAALDREYTDHRKELFEFIWLCSGN